MVSVVPKLSWLPVIKLFVHNVGLRASDGLRLDIATGRVFDGSAREELIECLREMVR